MRREIDYHFWYQTSNGQWANKHGWSEFSAPELLDVGVIPSSTYTTGWALDAIDDDGNLEARFWEFYNCQIYSYIITVSN